MRKIFALALCAMFFIVTFGLMNASAAEPPSYRINFTVQLRDDISVDMGAIVVLNPSKPTGGLTVLVCNGTGQNSNTFQPLAERVVMDKVGKKISRFVLLNYPGHANSSLPISPSGAKLGDLSLDDYVTAVLKSMEALTAIDMRPDIIMGHSVGAEIFQLTQEKLLKQGTTLRKMFGIKGAIFIVPDIAGPSPWGFTDSGAAVGVLQMLSTETPEKGMIVRFPPPVFLAFFFANRAGMVVPGSPTPDQVVERGYVADDSAKFAADFLGLGSSGQRPQLTEGSFAPSNGTATSLVFLEQDGLYTEMEDKTLYTYITKDQGGSMFFSIKGADTVHDQHLLNTGALLDVFKKTLAKAK